MPGVLIRWCTRWFHVCYPLWLWWCTIRCCQSSCARWVCPACNWVRLSVFDGNQLMRWDIMLNTQGALEHFPYNEQQLLNVHYSECLDSVKGQLLNQEHPVSAHLTLWEIWNERGDGQPPERVLWSGDYGLMSPSSTSILVLRVEGKFITWPPGARMESSKSLL